MSTPTITPDGKYNVRIDTGHGLVITVDPYEISEYADEEALIRLAKGLCWDEIMRQAALRLVRESDDNQGNYDSECGDQRTRLEFLAEVESSACDGLLLEIKIMKKHSAEITAERDRLFNAIAGDGGDYNRWSRALAIARGDSL